MIIYEMSGEPFAGEVGDGLECAGFGKEVGGVWDDDEVFGAGQLLQGLLVPEEDLGI